MTAATVRSGPTLEVVRLQGLQLAEFRRQLGELVAVEEECQHRMQLAELRRQRGEGGVLEGERLQGRQLAELRR